MLNRFRLSGFDSCGYTRSGDYITRSSLLRWRGAIVSSGSGHDSLCIGNLLVDPIDLFLQRSTVREALTGGLATQWKDLLTVG